MFKLLFSWLSSEINQIAFPAELVLEISKRPNCIKISQVKIFPVGSREGRHTIIQQIQIYHAHRCIEITHHRFQQFFYNLLCMSQPCIDYTSRELSLNQDMQRITQVLIAWFSSQFVLLEKSCNHIGKACCNEAESGK